MEITEKTKEFFKLYKIKDDELKFRYIDLNLKLNYSKVESMLKSEQNFNKILLFLSFNHPEQYPDYVSPEEFSIKYSIDETTLNYYVREIVDNEFFQVKFFKIEDEQSKVYYFQKNEPIEKILNAIVEKYIIKATYLNKFQDAPTLDIAQLLENIINDVCSNLFKEDLKGALKTFLPTYIKYLAYRIETEKKLIDSDAKLEGFVWQNIFEEFQTFEPSTASIGEGEEIEYSYTMDKGIFDVLDIVYLSKLNFLKRKEVQEAYGLRNLEIFEKISKSLYKDKVKKVREIYEQDESDLTNITQLILDDLITTAENNFEESIKITTEIIKKYPTEFIGYLLQSITYFLKDDYEPSLEIIEKGFKKAPNLILFYQKAQIFIKTHRGEEFQSEIEETLLKHPQDITLLRLKFVLYITHWMCCLKSREHPLEIINSLIKLNPNDKELLILKCIYYFMTNEYREGKRFLIREINFNLFKKNPKVDISAFFLLTFSYLARGKFEKALKIANQLSEIYPNHPISYLTKALVLGYNLIYKFKFQDPNIDTFLNLINTAISYEPLYYRKVKYLILQTYVLNGVKQYNESLDTINKAIELAPNLLWLYQMKTFFLISAKREREALDAIDEYTEKYPQIKPIMYLQKSFILSQILHKYDEALEVIDDMAKSYPDDVKVVNNRTLFLAHLGRKEEAIESAEHLIKLSPKDGNSYDTYGEAFMIFGEYENAIDKFEEALKIEPSGGFAFQTCIKMGKCYQKLGFYDEALEYYEKGKLLTERMIPIDRDLYEHEADKYISELRGLINNTRTNNNET